MIGNRLIVAVAVFASLLSAGCGGKAPTQPTTPSSPGSPTSADPVARLQVRVDDGTPRDAIASMSDVVVDASASTGSGALTFAIDFGDGAVATSPTARHTYANAGAFTISATVTDAQGRKATDSGSVSVKAVVGRWFQTEYVKRNTRVEVRQLSIDAQDGLTIRGHYRVARDAERSFTGTLTPPRTIQLATPDGAGLLGLLPDRLNDPAVAWTLIARGDAVDGERLDFHAIVGEPTGPPPHAVLKLSWDTDDRDAWAPWVALNPIRVDGTASTGDGLTYWIVFGDGFVATTAQASHIEDGMANWSVTATLTVVDRFGRSETDAKSYFLATLGGEDVSLVLQDYWPSVAFDRQRVIRFSQRTGVNYTGVFYGGYFTDPAPAFATMSGTRDVRITVPSLGVEYRGSIKMSPGNNALMTLVQSGGTDSGRTWSFYRRSAY